MENIALGNNSPPSSPIENVQIYEDTTDQEDNTEKRMFLLILRKRY